MDDNTADTEQITDTTEQTADELDLDSPLTEEQAVQCVLFSLELRRDDMREEYGLKFINLQIDGLERTLKLIDKYRALAAALAVLKSE